MDRIDIFVEVPRVEAARAQQAERFAGTRTTTNAEMAPTEVRACCQALLDDDARALLRLAMNQLSLSARAFHRVLKIARTIADLAGKDTIGAPHLAEAIQYRRRAVT